MRTRELPVTRIDYGYAWGVCMAIPDDDGRPVCGNTVKFGKPGTASVCPACGAGWHCSENEEDD